MRATRGRAYIAAALPASTFEPSQNLEVRLNPV
jgi:hypothetical protein